LVAGSTTFYGTGGGIDGYAAKLTSSGTLSWTKTFGGSSTDEIQSVIQNANGDFVMAGLTASYVNPTGQFDWYLLKMASDGTFCGPNTSSGGNSGSGGATGTDTNNPSTTIADRGAAGTTSSFTGTTTSLFSVSVSPASANICQGTSTTLTASGASGYSWSPSTGLNNTTGASVIASPTTTTTYTVVGTGTTNCNPQTVTVNVTPVSPNACTNCNTVICVTDANMYTVNAGQTLCVVPGGTVTGTIVLNGGTICNSGTFTPSSFTMNSGTFNNYSQFTYNNNVALLSTSTFNNLSTGIIQITGTIKAASGAKFLESSGSKLLTTP
jgi:hypothetical protein